MVKSEQPPDPQAGPPSSVPPRRDRRKLKAIAALVGAVAIGAGITAALPGRRAALVMLPPVSVAAMQDWSPVAVKGQVAEIFGNKFIIQDKSGRALVETGREGEGGGLVEKSETITVQGRFERGFIHAVAISHVDGHTDLVGPPRPRAKRSLAWFSPHWPRVLRLHA